MFALSTKTQLITFILFALLVNRWNLTVLLVLMSLLLAMLIYLSNRHYFQLSYRLKWFYLVMFAIFALNTPGEHIASWPFNVKPTYEGVLMGLEQVLRIATILGLLSLVLTHNTKQQLISGIYFLTQPLSSLGIDVKRFSARLWLTLYYVELQQSDLKNISLKGGINQYLEYATMDTEDKDVEIVLENPRLTVTDYIVLSVMALMTMYSIYLAS